MNKPTAAFLIGCLIALVVYVSAISLTLVRELNSAPTLPSYAVQASNDSESGSKLEVATETERNDGSEEKAQPVRSVRHRKMRLAGGHRSRVKVRQEAVTLML